MSLTLLPLLLLLTAVSTTGGEQSMGENVLFNLSGEAVETFVMSKEQKEDEVLKIQLHPMGRKGARPVDDTPVWLWVEERDERHQWMLPWRPGGAGSPAYDWLEVLLCTNQRSLRLMAMTNGSVALPLRWHVSTENVALGNGGTMKSTLSDVSYRRFRWPAAGALAVDLEVRSVTGGQVCGTLAVARRCVTHPHQLSDAHLLAQVRFSRSAQLTVNRADAPDGFWLYLIPEANNLLCPGTAGRGPDSLPPPAKTVRVHWQARTFAAATTPAPRVDGDLPRGAAVGGDGDASWAAPPQAGTCDERLLALQQECAGELQF